jgi:surfeit locus 1 family protein
MADAAAPDPPARRRSLILLGLFTLLGVAILTGLGFWQVERLGAKKRLIARVEKHLAAAPTELPPPHEWPYMKPKAYEYVRVRVKGTFENDKEAHLYGLRSSGVAGKDAQAGYYVLTPFVLSGENRAVLVNRGFVPADRKDPATRAEGQLTGEQTVVGLLRAPEPRGLFTPADDPARNMWFTRDPSAIGAALGIQGLAPFVIEADETPVPGGLPVGGNTRVSFPNNHLQYAITWFTLAIALVIVFIAFARSQRRAG